jgi:hypothetical protein
MKDASVISSQQGLVKITVIGGCGFWSEINHYKNLLSISDVNYKIVAVVDYKDPNDITRHCNFQEIIKKFSPDWLNPKEYHDTDEIIKELKEKFAVNLVIIATNPVAHYEYALSCVKNNVNVLLDKPMISANNASTGIGAAKNISRKFGTLVKEYEKALLKNPKLICHSMLRRRSLEPFLEIADQVSKIHSKFAAGINNMSVIVNGGKYKFPAELLSSGAHSYLDGVGSISHSAYHYIDLIAWYLSLAAGKARKIRITPNYIFRIRDYLAAESYDSVARVNNEETFSLTTQNISTQIAGCELNAGFNIDLLNDDNAKLGHITFNLNLLSFSPRTVKFDANVGEPADSLGGGRMSHLNMEIHQSGLKYYHIMKDDIVFTENEMSLRIRSHPNLDETELVDKQYSKAYISGMSLADGMRDLLKSISENVLIKNHPLIRFIIDEKLSMEIYGAMYELVAAEYGGKVRGKIIQL